MMTLEEFESLERRIWRSLRFSDPHTVDFELGHLLVSCREIVTAAGPSLDMRSKTYDKLRLAEALAEETLDLEENGKLIHDDLDCEHWLQLLAQFKFKKDGTL